MYCLSIHEIHKAIDYGLSRALSIFLTFSVMAKVIKYF